MSKLAIAEIIELTLGMYHIWEPLAKAMLQRNSCFDVCEDDDPPTKPSEPEISDALSITDRVILRQDFREELRFYKQWRRRNDKAIGLIMGTISPEQRSHIENLPTAKQCWEKLAHVHSSENAGVASFYIARSILDKRYHPEEDIRDHISWFTIQNNRLTEDFKFSEEFLALLILTSLPRGNGSLWETQALLCLQSTPSTSKLTIADITATLTTEWLRQHPLGLTMNAALKAARASTPKQSKTQNGKQKPACTFCGYKNHMEWECQKKHAARRQIQVKSYAIGILPDDDEDLFSFEEPYYYPSPEPVGASQLSAPPAQQDTPTPPVQRHRRTQLEILLDGVDPPPNGTARRVLRSQNSLPPA